MVVFLSQILASWKVDSSLILIEGYCDSNSIVHKSQMFIVRGKPLIAPFYKNLIGLE